MVELCNGIGGMSSIFATVAPHLVDKITGHLSWSEHDMYHYLFSALQAIVIVRRQGQHVD